MSKPIDSSLRQQRAAWAHRGHARPSFARAPGPGEESVWDYPRPPRIVEDHRTVEIRVGDASIARSDRSLRVLETASPPTIYVPPGAIAFDLLERAAGSSHCEWKGTAMYWDVVVGARHIERAAWSYEAPYPEFESIAGHLGFYPGRVSCWLGGQPVQSQAGGFYGGWITPEIVGPFKGEPGTSGW